MAWQARPLRRLGRAFSCPGAVGFVIFLGLAVAYGPAVQAQEIGRPIYDPNTKSYFELRNDNRSGYWEDAHRLAASKVYRGVRGRLAVVNSAAVHSFLRRTFKLASDQPTWIGLRYWCKYRKLQWVTGRLHVRGEYSNWNRPWYNHPETVCGKGATTLEKGYMPVFYSPTERGFRWKAAGAGKGFIHYFVEYPTGQE